MQQRPVGRPPAPATAAPSSRRRVPADPGASDAVRVQILATEHWSLLATRSLLWSEAFTRASIFLTVLSAAVVALALVAQATGTDEDFTLFGLVVLPVVLFEGIATYVRLMNINNEDVRMVQGMNRLRRGYLDVAPDLEPYFVTGHHDDVRGLAETLGAELELPRPFWLKVLVSTPGVVGVIDCVLVGVSSGLALRKLNMEVAPAAVVGAVGALLFLALLVALPVRHVKRWERTLLPRFPH